MKRIQRNAGFTLMELLVVIAIITILTTIVGIKILHKPAEVKITVARTNLIALRDAIQLYKLDNGFIPTQSQGLQALVVKATTSPVPATFPPDGYLTSRNVPQDPWNHDFIYLAPGRKNEPFEIITYGSDGEPGGAADAADLSTSDL